MTRNAPLAIALASSSFFPNVGGAEVTLHNLAENLTTLGHKPVVLIGFNHWRSLRTSLNDFTYPILPLLPKLETATKNSIYLHRLAQYAHYSWLQRKYRFDLWQSFGIYPTGVSVAQFTKPRQIPHVIRAVGYDIQVSEDINYGYRLDPKIDQLVRKWAPTSSQMVALSDSVIPSCTDMGVPQDRVRVIPCAVDDLRFDSIQTNRTMVRDQYSIPKEAFAFITVGRNHPKKGFIHLIEAVEILSKTETRPFCAVFVGKDMEPLQHEARRRQIENYVCFVEELGPDSGHSGFKIPSRTLIDLYHSVDACAFPSLMETFAMINIEAMAAKIPVITTDAPGCIETVNNGVDGLIARAGDSKSLAHRMSELMNSEELRARLVSKASDKLASNYTWNIVVKEFEGLYLELLRNEEK